MTCRRLFDPVTLGVAALAVTAVAGAGAAVSQGFAAEAQADAEAADLKAAAMGQRVEAQRAIRDEKEEQRLRTARIIALASARGNVGTGALARSEGESALRIQRIRQDAEVNAANLNRRASNVREAGDFTRRQSIFQAGASLVGAGLSGASMMPGGGGGTGLTPTTPAYRKASTGRLAGPV